MLVQLPRPNIFLAGSLSLSQLQIDRVSEPDEASHGGIVGRLSIGTQWRTSTRWMLGVAGELTLGRMASVDGAYALCGGRSPQRGSRCSSREPSVAPVPASAPATTTPATRTS